MRRGVTSVRRRGGKGPASGGDVVGGEVEVHLRADAGHELTEREKRNSRCWTVRMSTANQAVSG